MIKYLKHITILLSFFLMSSCFDSSKPNYQYFPNMYESVGYGTYDESDAFPNGIEAQLPVEGSVPRGWQPYEFEDSNEGYELAKDNLTSPLLNNEDNLANGKKMYEIYCSVCHGSKGDGNCNYRTLQPCDFVNLTKEEDPCDKDYVCNPNNGMCEAL